MVSIGEKPWVRIVESSDTYGQYVVEPLDRGYGSTLGNSLRRVLLSSLYGAAITAVKIEGIDHSFSTIPGVVEDVLQIMLNLKEVVIRSHSEQPKTVKLKVKGKGEVTAADIEHDAEIEIVNPDAAVKESANILAKHVELFVHLGEKVEILGIGPEKKDEIGEGILEMNVEDLELSARSLNCLKNAGLNTVGELIANSLSDLMKFKNFGAKSLDEVQEKLTEYKLTLKGERGA